MFIPRHATHTHLPWLSLSLVSDGSPEALVASLVTVMPFSALPHPPRLTFLWYLQCAPSDIFISSHLYSLFSIIPSLPEDAYASM